MQLNETTSAAAISSDTKVQVLVSECDMSILSACRRGRRDTDTKDHEKGDLIHQICNLTGYKVD